MKYKLFALALFVGISPIVFSNSSQNNNHYIINNEEISHNINFENFNSSDNSFNKGDLLAFNWNAGDYNSDINKKKMKKN